MERENEALDILFMRLSACKKYQGSYSQVVNKGRVAAKGESIPCCCCPCRPWQGPAILQNRNQVHLTCYQRKIKYPRPHFLFLFTFSPHKNCDLYKLEGTGKCAETVDIIHCFQADLVPVTLICRNVNINIRRASAQFSFKSGSMLVFLNSYLATQRKNDTDVIFRSHGTRKALEAGADIAVTFLYEFQKPLHVDNRRKKAMQGLFLCFDTYYSKLNH